MGTAGAGWDGRSMTGGDSAFSMDTVELRQLLGLPVFRGSAVIAGAKGLSNPVRWVHSSDLPDIAYWLKGGELILHSGIRHSGTTLSHLIRELYHAGAAGLMVASSSDIITDDAIQTADNLNFPLISMPDELRFVDATYDVSNALLSHNVGMAVEIERFWNSVSLALHSDLYALLQTISDWLNMPVALFDQTLKRVLINHPRTLSENFSDLENLLLRDADRHELQKTNFIRIPSEFEQWTHVVKGIQSAGQFLGAIAVQPQESQRTYNWDRMLTPVARALAVALERSSASNDPKIRLNADLLYSLLYSSVKEPAAMKIVEVQLGLDTRRPLVVAVLQLMFPSKEHEDDLNARVIQVMTQHNLPPVFCTSGRETAVLIQSVRTRKQYESIVREITESLKKKPQVGSIVRCGVGEMGNGIEGVLSSYGQAKTACLKAKDSSPVFFQDLNTWHLLIENMNHAEIRKIGDQRLSKLSKRDYQQLRQSLNAIIESDFNYAEVARRLDLHRNGLIQRLHRFSDKTGYNFTSAQDIIAVWIILQLE